SRRARRAHSGLSRARLWHGARAGGLLVGPQPADRVGRLLPAGAASGGARPGLSLAEQRPGGSPRPRLASDQRRQPRQLGLVLAEEHRPVHPAPPGGAIPPRPPAARLPAPLRAEVAMVPDPQPGPLPP